MNANGLQWQRRIAMKVLKIGVDQRNGNKSA